MSDIDRITLYRLKHPLKKPYKLAFGPVTHFDTLIAEVRSKDGHIGLGEATILNGYTDETIDSSWEKLKALSIDLGKARLASAQEVLSPATTTHPFTATALMTAVEMISNPEFFQIDASRRVPILGIVNGVTDDELAQEIPALHAAGFRTLKVKVGFEVQSDLAQVQRVQKNLLADMRIRIDGNQGYSRDQALAFVRAINPQAIELFEQPCAADDWDSAVVIASQSPIPMMLDESIYGFEDIARAKSLGCASFVKLKLMKFCSMRRLDQGLRQIKSLGMTAVLGNGVAGEIGCWMESIAAASQIDNAGEMNGFLKPVSSVLKNPLRFENGAVLLEPGYQPMLDMELVDRYLFDRFTTHS